MFSLPYVILGTSILSLIISPLRWTFSISSVLLLSNALKSMQAEWFQMVTLKVCCVRLYLASRITIYEASGWVFISKWLERYFTWVVPAIIVVKRATVWPMYLQWTNLKMSTNVHLIQLFVISYYPVSFKCLFSN